MRSREDEFERLVEHGGCGGKWAEFLVPEDAQTDLLSDDSQPASPGEGVRCEGVRCEV